MSNFLDLEEDFYDDDDIETEDTASDFQKAMKGISSWWVNTKKAWMISYKIYPQIFVFNILFSLKGFIAPTVSLLLVKPIMDFFKDGQITVSFFQQYYLVGVIAGIIYVIIIFVSPYIVVYLENKYKDFPIRKTLFVKEILVHIPYVYSIDSEKAYKVNRFRRFVDDIFDTAKDQISVITSVFGIILGVSVGANIDPVFVIVMTITALFSVYTMFRQQDLNMDHANSREENLLETRSHSISNALDFPSLTTFLAHQSDWLFKIFPEVEISLRNRKIERKKRESLAKRKNNFFEFGSVLIMLSYLFFRIKTGNVIDAVATFYIITRIKEYIRDLGWELISQNTVQKTLGYVSEIMDISEEQKQLEEKKHSPNLSNGIEISFQNVSFYYPSETDIDEKEWVLQNVSFTISLDRLYGLQGANGNGKTTMFKLLMGYLEPVSGTITINNINVKDIKRLWFRRTFGSYDPGMHIIDGMTLFEFLTVDTLIDTPQEQRIQFMKTCLQEVGLSKKIGKKDITTLILDPQFPEGTDFSSGQMQRLLIARMLMNLYAGAQYVLADEMTSNISFNDQKGLALLLKKRSKGGILIAHNPSMIEVCDDVLVCENGNIFSKLQIANN